MSLRDPLRAASVALVVFAAALAVAGSAVSAAASAAAATKTAATPAAGNADAGKAIFKVKCVACHKVDGTGGFKVTGNPTPNWTLKKTWDATRTDAYLRDCITNGKTKSGMVAWGKTGQVKPAQIEDLIAYIKTFKAAAK
jgi:mono/diheme cytochrome c family protein